MGQSTAIATPEEEYGATYLALVHGADGILYWNFDDARKDARIWQTGCQIAD